MTVRLNSKIGYSKKELMKIVKEIDADLHQSQMENQNEKLDANKRKKDCPFTRE